MSSESEGAKMIAMERKRQIEELGWSAEHDDEHTECEIAWAATCYAAPGSIFKEKHVLRSIRMVDPWPWDKEYDKRKSSPTTDERIRELVKAGALLAAETDRLLRLKAKESSD